MSENKRIFTEDEFKLRLIPLIMEGLSVPLVVSGGSMEPFLTGMRDTVHITAPEFPLKKGDIAFFERANGKIVMHRICKVTKEGYFFVGDAQTEIEGPIPRQAVFGMVKSVTRKGKTESDGFTWWFFRNVWIRIIPLRPFCVKVYNAVFKRKKKK